MVGAERRVLCREDFASVHGISVKWVRRLLPMGRYLSINEENMMVEPLFIKAEPQWSTGDEESSNVEEPVQIKVEPDLLFPDQTLDEENGQVVKREVESQEVLSEDEGEEHGITEPLLSTHYQFQLVSPV
ncbi:uncharacterized protein [Anabrus simplex]|uniref:uncharacterized protein isoform X5 n=1 Tax=Anabrus simplex TaxID=316456 RepID=UPI0034DCE240